MKVLLLNQCFYPDVAATGQYLTELARALTEKGHRVTVISSRRAYDDPEKTFSGREQWQGIDIIRIPTLGLGKASKWRRALDFASFLLFCFVRLMFLPRQDLTVALTSPPLISFFGALFARLRGGRFCFWVMDLNPDEAIAAGWLREDSLIAKILQALLQYSLKHSDKIFALDRFMRDRLEAKGVGADKIMVLPPWSHDEDIVYDENGRLEFRAQHGLANKFVVMYSGNHSPCHPLDTLLEAARKLEQHNEIRFCFVGGGSEFQKVKGFAARHALANVLCLPYQLLNELSGSLSAADLHVVVMGDDFRGLVHPCKVYNIIAIGSPFLYIGPEESHVSDLFRHEPAGLLARPARHGEADTVAAQILQAAAAGPLRVKGAEEVSAHFAQSLLLPRMVGILEQIAGPPALKPATPAQSEARARRA
jgi:glycosyltransferase involved in cell wall biosynthesis